jgi:hypothetical protein
LSRPPLGDRLARARDALARVDGFGLALRVSLLALLLDVPIYWFQREPVVLVAGLGLVWPRAARSRVLWLLLFVFTAWPLFWNWPFSDNHDYLRALWCLAVLTSLACPDPRRALAWNGRMLIGLTFAFAVLWKALLSPDFRNGTFFRVTLLTDGRLRNLAVLAGGMRYPDLDAYADALDGFQHEQRPWNARVLHEPAALGRLAIAATVFTLLVEGAVAVCFLWPWPRGPSRWRNGALLLFLVATYAFATVRGFGFLLAALGAAQCRREEPGARFAYVGAFFLVDLYANVPWSSALVSWLGRG